jgi:2-polyprenyl-3-methyl-5-hydroxy-6-metoxy-1,4-benzoquinol methylase
MKNYCIKENYIARNEYIHYDDQEEEDKWQLEIYLHALGLMKKYNLATVTDLGCGSGYKLMTYLNDYKTIGLEILQNLEFLNQKYPNNRWLESNFMIDHKITTDVLICSDVIEHIVDPDDLIQYINKISFKYLVLSTPERDLVYKSDSPFLDGPPRNPAHQREWNFNEFKEYIGENFNIIDHRVTNLHQATQMIICTKK